MGQLYHLGFFLFRGSRNVEVGEDFPNRVAVGWADQGSEAEPRGDRLWKWTKRPVLEAGPPEAARPQGRGSGSEALCIRTEDPPSHFAEEPRDSSLTGMEGPDVWLQGNGRMGWGQRLRGHAFGERGLEPGKKGLGLRGSLLEGQTEVALYLSLLSVWQVSACPPVPTSGRLGALKTFFIFLSIIWLLHWFLTHVRHHSRC